MDPNNELLSLQILRRWVRHIGKGVQGYLLRLQDAGYSNSCKQVVFVRQKNR